VGAGATGESAYAAVLRRQLDRSALSPSAVARGAGLHHQLLARSLRGTRLPDSPDEVRALARALGLPGPALDELLEAAGYWPASFLALGTGDATLRALADALADPAVPLEQRRCLRTVVEELARSTRAVGARQAELERRLALLEGVDRAGGAAPDNACGTQAM
jgi:Helix-turn-helix domain